MVAVVGEHAVVREIEIEFARATEVGGGDSLQDSEGIEVQKFPLVVRRGAIQLAEPLLGAKNSGSSGRDVYAEDSGNLGAGNLIIDHVQDELVSAGKERKDGL